MNENSARKTLKGGGSIVGTMITGFCTDEVMPMIRAAGLDFIVIDTEHNPPGTETVAGLIRSARHAGVPPIVRVTDNLYPMIARVLDIGALGVMVPRVDTVEQARAAISYVKYPPHGIRGYGLRDPSKNYQKLSVAETLEWSNENTLVMLQVESQESLDNLDEIAALPGLDILFIGPMDLSISLGVPGDMEHPKMQAAFRRVIECAERHGVAGGAHLMDAESIKRWQSEGMRALLCLNDARIMTAALNQIGAQLGRTPRASSGGLY